MVPDELCDMARSNNDGRWSGDGVGFDNEEEYYCTIVVSLVQWQIHLRVVSRRRMQQQQRVTNTGEWWSEQTIDDDDDDDDGLSTMIY